MKKYSIFLLLAFFALLISCNEDKGPNKNLAKPTEYIDRLSYLIGYDMGSRMRTDSLNPNLQYMMLGLQLGLEGDTAYFTNADLQKIQSEFQGKLMVKQQTQKATQEAQIAKEGKENIVKTQQFLEENKKRTGVVTTPSGLQYEVMIDGTGPKPKNDEMVKVHIRATFADGKEFDNTLNREPPVLPVDGLIPGWKEALSMMKVGSKWKLFVPPNLAYGEKGLPGHIPPNAVLIFEVQLLSIEGKIPADHPANPAMKEQLKKEMMEKQAKGAR